MFHILIFSVALLSLAFTTLAAEESNLFHWGQGREEVMPGQPANTDPSTNNEFLAYSRGIRQENGLWILEIPKEDPRTNYRYVGVGPFPIKALARYVLDFRVTTCAGTYSSLFCATWLHHGEPTRFDTILSFPNFDTRLTRISQDFAAPPEADAMLLWIGISGQGKPVHSGPKLLMRDLAIREIGTMDGNSVLLKTKPETLLPVSDFETLEPGPFPSASHQGYFGHAGAMVTASVEVEPDGNHVLRLVKKADGYPFPHFRLPDLPFDNTWLRFSYRAKGSGSVAAGLWWMRGERTWAYGAGHFVELSPDEWKTVTYVKPCVDASAFGAAAAMHIGKSEADFVIDDLMIDYVGIEEL